jgi:hypothetical protein
MEEWRNADRFSRLSVKERDHLEDLKPHGRIRWILRKQDRMAWNGLIWLGIRRDAAF